MTNFPLSPTPGQIFVDGSNKRWIFQNSKWYPSYDFTSPTFVFTQAIPSATWSITHNLGKFPSVTVVDSAGSTVEGGIQYISNNEIEITFVGAFSGKAYLN